MTAEIRQLPSGFWAVWVNGIWVEASQPTREAAEKWAAEHLKDFREGK